jgi:hypothetical protein
METVICRFGSGVQRSMESERGPVYCTLRCGKRASAQYAIFHPDEASGCAEYASAWHAQHDAEWRRSIRAKEK